MSDIDVAEDSPDNESQPLLSEKKVKTRNKVAADSHPSSEADSGKKHDEKSEDSEGLDDLEPPDSLSFKLSRNEGMIAMEGQVFTGSTKILVGVVFLYSLGLVFLLSFFPIGNESDAVRKIICPNGGCTFKGDEGITRSRMFYYRVFLPTLGCAWLLAGYVLFFSREKVVLSRKVIEIERTGFGRKYSHRVPLNTVRAIKGSSHFEGHVTDAVTLGRRYKVKSVSSAEQAFVIKYLTNFVEKQRGPMKFPSHENLLDDTPGSRRISTLHGEDDLLSVPLSDNRVEWNEHEQCFIKNGQEIAYVEIVFWVVLSVTAIELLYWLYLTFIDPRTVMQNHVLYDETIVFLKWFAVVVGLMVAIPIYFLVWKVVLMWKSSLVKTKWFVEEDTVSQYSSGLCRPYHQDWKVSSVHMMELRWMGPAKHTAECQYSLRLIGPANEEKHDIKGLTEGEARWIAFKIKSIQNCAMVD